jgi:hypothetical protein
MSHGNAKNTWSEKTLRMMRKRSTHQHLPNLISSEMALKNSPLEQAPFLISIKLSPRSDRLKSAGNWLQVTVTRAQVT